MINFLNNLLNKLQLDNKKLILISLFFFIIVYADVTFFIKMQMDSIKNLKPQIVKFKHDIDTLNKSLSAGNNLNDKKNQVNIPSIISKDELSVLLEEISTLANNNEVTLMQIKAVKDPKKNDKTSESEKFEPLYISLDVSGGYHDVGAFINDLENAQYFIAVSDMDISHNERDPLRQSVNLLMKTYVKK